MLQLFSTDRHWELLARNDPYWAVATFDRFRRSNLTDENKDEFFQSGEDYIEWLFQMVRGKFDAQFAPQRSLDFGCGVGRLMIPLAKRSIEAVGVDVSRTMLQEAKQQLDARQITNARLIEGDDRLSNVEGPFDLVHSVMVFQHIPVRRGEAILKELIQRMRPGSVAALHFVYAQATEPHRPTLCSRLRRFLKRIKLAILALLGRPRMEMNDYSMSILFRILQEHGIKRTHAEFFDSGEFYNAILFFQKDANQPA